MSKDNEAAVAADVEPDVAPDHEVDARGEDEILAAHEAIKAAHRAAEDAELTIEQIRNRDIAKESGDHAAAVYRAAKMEAENASIEQIRNRAAAKREAENA